MTSPLQITGIGLRQPHYQDFLEKKPNVAWVEVHTENFFAEGGKALNVLKQVRENYPVSLHGVSLSLGSTDELNWRHIKQMAELIDLIDPCLVSDHLSWSSINGQYWHDLLPIPYIEEAIPHIVDRIKQVQDYLKRQILIENVSSYVTYKHSTIAEWDFLREVAEQSGCGILLDVNNVYVSSTNHHFNPEKYLNAIPGKLIQEIHLAGFTSTTIGGKEVLIDTHSRAVLPAVWDLFSTAVRLYGTKATVIEWDQNLPSLETLCLEAFRAEQILREAYATTKLAG